MKNNKGITLVALIVTIIVMTIIIGASVTGGTEVFQKSKATDYIGYMKLVKARADVVLEEEAFNSSLSNDSIADVDIKNKINNKGYNDYLIKKWNRR